MKNQAKWTAVFLLLSLGCRSAEEAPEIDGSVIVRRWRRVREGGSLRVKIVKTFDYDLEGEVL